MVTILKSADLVYGGMGYTPQDQLERMVKYDAALVQILYFLESDPEVSKRYNAYCNKLVQDEIDKAKAAAAALAKAKAEAEAKILLAKKQAIEAEEAARAAEKAAISKQIAALENKGADVAAVAKAEVETKTLNAEIVADDANPDLNGDGRLDKNEMLTRLKADGIVLDAGLHYKRVEKAYKEKYGS